MLQGYQTQIKAFLSISIFNETLKIQLNFRNGSYLLKDGGNQEHDVIVGNPVLKC